jgi:tripartite-type tricarboxylate transporter receptor subunit TctC
MRRLHFAALASVAALSIINMQSIGSAQTTSYPGQRVITLVVPAAAGGATDIIARIIAQHLTQSLGRNVIVENRGGANGNIGSAFVARSDPDGHTLLLAPSNNIVINQFTTMTMGYDPIADLAPVALVADAPGLIVTPASFPATTIAELVQAVRSKPDLYSYSSPGIGTPPQLFIERLLRITGMKMAHVPYRGAAPAMADVATGVVQLSVATLGSVEPFRQAGTVRILAVAGAERLKPIAAVPTLAEAGWNNLEMSTWWGVMAPKATPVETITLLNAKLREAFTDSETTRPLGGLGILPRAQSVDEFARFIQDELRTWKAIVDDIGLQRQ